MRMNCVYKTLNRIYKRIRHVDTTFSIHNYVHIVPSWVFIHYLNVIYSKKMNTNGVTWRLILNIINKVDHRDANSILIQFMMCFVSK